ncbi:MAG TPA: TldD/PmbA family protein [Nocardioidaceae bacterium]|nr:TldD/PmbA family protein [Nocardioidaceae bacterium]
MITQGDTGRTVPLNPDELHERLAAAVATPDADELEIAVLARAGEYTRFAGDVVHQPQDITEVQYLVRAVVDGNAFRTATTTGEGLTRAVRTAAAGARERARLVGSAGTAAHPAPTGRNAPAAEELPDEVLWFDDVAGFDRTARVSAARDAMRQAAVVDGEAAGMFGRAVVQQAVAGSAGGLRLTAATEAYGALTVTVADGTSHWVDLSRSAERLRLAGAVDDAVALAARSRGRTPLEAGTYPVVLGPEAVGEFLQFLPELGFSGELAAAGIGVAATRPGQQVVSEAVEVADDARADVGLPIGFDIEGTTKRRVPLIEHGRVGRPVTDRATAQALGTVPTGHAHIAREQVPAPEAANIVMAAGDADEQDLLAGVEDGVYIQRFWYTRLVDRTTGTITGVTRDACFRIEGGRLTRPLDGMRFTESVLRVLSGVTGIGRERRAQPVMNVWNGATTAPAVRAEAFRLGAAPEGRGRL